MREYFPYADLYKAQQQPCTGYLKIKQQHGCLKKNFFLGATTTL